MQEPFLSSYVQSTHDGTSHDELLTMDMPARRTCITAHTSRAHTAHTYPHMRQKHEKWHNHRERSVSSCLQFSQGGHLRISPSLRCL